MYIAGITNGPIFDTIQEASSPVALWFASAVFSEYTRMLCSKITAEISDALILSPYYDEYSDLSDGVGKFHDRIIFKSNETEVQLKDALKQIIDRTKSEMIELFLDPKFQDDESRKTDNGFSERDIESGRTFLQTYLYSEFVILSDENVQDNAVLAISDALDAMELMRDFPGNDHGNPFRKLFAGRDAASNLYLKNCALLRKVTVKPNPLIDSDGNVLSIEKIAKGGTNTSKDPNRSAKLKKHYYYAVVSADGDGMGNYLKKIDDAHVKDFSKCCFDYVVEAAARIHEFGGMPIYAGGDDMLFLAPVESTDGKKTIYKLCAEINELFQRKLSENRELNAVKAIQDAPKPTISFGISIQFVKYPLYEALAESRYLLDGIVKSSKATRNSMAVCLQKHSGQTISLRISNPSEGRLEQYLTLGRIDVSSENQKEEEQNETNVIRQLSQFSVVLEYLNQKATEPDSSVSRESYLTAWRNFFDNPAQEGFIQYLNELGGMFYDDFLVTNVDEKKTIGIEIPEAILSCYEKNSDSRIQRYVQTLISILRLRKFNVEKAGEEEISR